MIKKGFIAILAILLLSTGCNSKVEKGSNPNNTHAKKDKITQEITFKNVDVEDARSMIRDFEDLVIIDVRTPEEIADGKIKGALEIDINGGSFDTAIEKLNKNNTYLVYCKSGGRSVKASKKMVKAGFPNVTNLKGGYTEWKATRAR